MTRRRWLGIGAAVLVVVLAVGGFFLVVRSGGDDADPVPGSRTDPGRAAAAAEDACTEMGRVEALVRANAKADDVFGAIDRASDAGKRAAADDLKWLPLSSGIEAVKAGLRNNDGPAANVGIRSTRAYCPD